MLWYKNVFVIIRLISQTEGLLDKVGGRRKFYLRVELIKCIDPNEGEALKRGGRGEGGRREGGRGGGRGGRRKFYLGGRIDQMY